MNILSYVNKPISGREVKDWIDYNLVNQTEYSRLARTLQRYANLKDEDMYVIRWATTNAVYNKKAKRGRPLVTRSGK